jgi:glucan phosphoethanolaminetransferase (alkaline phosphatase superfamily)
MEILRSLLLGTIISLCLLSIDHANRWLHPNLNQVYRDSEYLVCLIMFTLPFLNKNRNFLIISGAIILVMLIQLIYFNYFGVPLSPMDIILFLTHSTESLQAFTSMVQIIYLPLVVCGLAALIIYFSHRILNERMRLKYACLLLFLEMCFPISNIFQTFYFHHGVRHHTNKSIGDYPDVGDSLWVSSNKTLVYFLIYTLPHQFFLKNHFNSEIISTPALRQQFQKWNIILIMGESLTSKHLSVYHYSRMTTSCLKRGSRLEFAPMFHCQCFLMECFDLTPARKLPAHVGIYLKWPRKMDLRLILLVLKAVSS